MALTARNGAGRANPAALTALLLVLAGIGAIALVWGLEARGYMPCELCLLERKPFYLAIPLAAATALAGASGRHGLARGGLLLLAALFLIDAGIGLYHAGVEWHFWAGPSSCTGIMAPSVTGGDLLAHMDDAQITPCDQAALRVLGVSLAGWNAVLCLILAVVALLGWRADRTR